MFPKIQRVKCSAKRSNGVDQCKLYAIPGGNVCRKHGGASPQALRKAQERIDDLIDPGKVLRHAAAIAFSDVGDIMDENGAVKPISEWPASMRQAVSQIQTMKRNETAGDKKQEEVRWIKLWDKPKALELLFRHLSLFRDRIEIGFDPGILVTRIEEGRKALRVVSHTPLLEAEVLSRHPVISAEATLVENHKAEKVESGVG